MHDPAQLTSEQLKRQLAEFVASEGDEAFSTWLPKSLPSYAMWQVDARNLTPQKVKLFALSVETSILDYISALIRGFLQPSEEKNYLARRELGELEEIKFPVYTLEEANQRIVWLASKKNELYRQTFSDLMIGQLSQSRCVAMVAAAELDLSQVTLPPEGYQFDAIELMPVWAPYQEKPSVFADAAWRAAMRKEKVSSILGHVSMNNRIAERSMGRDSGQAYAELTEQLANKVVETATRLEQLETEEEQLLTGLLARFDQAEDGEKAAVALECVVECKQACAQRAGLAAENLYLKRLSSLHQFWQLPLEKKLRKFVGGRFSSRLIPCGKVIEIVYHVELLIANMETYIAYEASDNSDGTEEVLNRTGRVAVDGEVMVLTEAEKAGHGAFIAVFLKPRLQRILDRLQAVNFAEARRDEVERALGRLARELDILLPKLERQIASLEEIPAFITRASNEFETGRLSRGSAARLHKLVQLAPGEHAPGSVSNFEQLLPLYAGTAVAARELEGFHLHGLPDASYLLHLLVKRPINLERLERVIDLLVAGAKKDHIEQGVRTITWVYEAIKAAQSDEAREQGLRLYTILQGFDRLSSSGFTVGEPAGGTAAAGEPVIADDWLSQSARAILAVVASKTGAHVEQYWDRDSGLVLNLLLRLVRDLFFGRVDRNSITASQPFQALSHSWDYLSVPVQTMQLFAGESYPVKLKELHASIYAIVSSVFKDPRYKRVMEMRCKMLASVSAELPFADQMFERGVSIGEQMAYQDEMNAYGRRTALHSQQRLMFELLLQQPGGMDLARQIVQQLPQLAGQAQQPLRLQDLPAAASLLQTEGGGAGAAAVVQDEGKLDVS
jgi:hypothetical protein